MGEAEVELTILMPCLNEAETLARLHREGARLPGDASAIAGEVLVADNGSTDGSQEIAAELRAPASSRCRERGYGAALSAASRAARGRYRDHGRRRRQLRLRRNLGRLRRASCARAPTSSWATGSAAASSPAPCRPCTAILAIPCSQLHRPPAVPHRRSATSIAACAASRAARSSSARPQDHRHGVRQRDGGQGRARRLQHRARCRPRCSPTAAAAPPHLRTWRDGWRHLKFLLLYSPRWLFFYPGFLLTGLGLLLSAVLAFGPVRLAPGLELDLSSFLAACLATIMGVQLITFGALARYYATVSGMLPLGPRSSYLMRWCKTDKVVQVAALLILSAPFCSSALCLSGPGSASAAWPTPSCPALSRRASVSSLLGFKPVLQVSCSAFSIFRREALDSPAGRAID